VIKDILVFVIYKFFSYFFIFMPKFILKYILKFLSYFIYIINIKHRKIAFLNLDLAFKDTKSKEEKRNIIKYTYKNLFLNIYEFINNQYISNNKILSKVNVINENYVLDAIKQNRKIILVASHFGCWEQFAYLSIKYGKLAIVSRRMNNQYINKDYIKTRTKKNIIMIEKKEAAKGMIRALRDDYNLLVAIDQNSPKGIDVDFFGLKTKTISSTSKLALKFDALLIPIFCKVNDFEDYTITFKQPIDTNKIEDQEFKNDPILYLTQKQTHIIEGEIRKYPSQWFWQHKRWKYYYNQLYRKL